MAKNPSPSSMIGAATSEGVLLTPLVPFQGAQGWLCFQSTSSAALAQT